MNPPTKALTVSLLHRPGPTPTSDARADSLVRDRRALRLIRAEARKAASAGLTPRPGQPEPSYLQVIDHQAVAAAHQAVERYHHTQTGPLTTMRTWLRATPTLPPVPGSRPKPLRPGPAHRRRRSQPDHLRPPPRSSAGLTGTAAPAATPLDCPRCPPPHTEPSSPRHRRLQRDRPQWHRPPGRPRRCRDPPTPSCAPPHHHTLKVRERPRQPSSVRQRGTARRGTAAHDPPVMAS